MKRMLMGMVLVCAIGVAMVSPLCGPRASAQGKALTKGFVKGAPDLQSIGSLSFGPDGLLVVADPKAGAVYCIETGDLKKVAGAQSKVENIDAVVAAKLGTTAAGVTINDLQVNPASSTVYLSVTKKDDQKPALLTIDRAGKPSLVMLDNVSYGKITLPTKDGVKLTTITDVEFAKSRILVAASATEEFASKVYSITLPFLHGGKADVFSTETFHVSHNRLETRAPIRTLTSYNDGKQDYAVGAFTCTPIVKYPVNQLGPDAKVRGTSVVELGSMNQPLDMFFYKKDGQEWLLVSNNVHGVLKVTAKVFKETDNVDERALHRRRVNGQFPPADGIETINALQGTVKMSPSHPDQVVIIRKTDTGMTLEAQPLP